MPRGESRGHQCAGRGTANFLASAFLGALRFRVYVTVHHCACMSAHQPCTTVNSKLKPCCENCYRCCFVLPLIYCTVLVDMSSSQTSRFCNCSCLLLSASLFMMQQPLLRSCEEGLDEQFLLGPYFKTCPTRLRRLGMQEVKVQRASVFGVSFFSQGPRDYGFTVTGPLLHPKGSLYNLSTCGAVAERPGAYAQCD